MELQKLAVSLREGESAKGAAVVQKSRIRIRRGTFDRSSKRERGTVFLEGSNVKITVCTFEHFGDAVAVQDALYCAAGMVAIEPFKIEINPAKGLEFKYELTLWTREKRSKVQLLNFILTVMAKLLADSIHCEGAT